LKGYPIGILHDQERFHVSRPPFDHGSSSEIVRFSDSCVVALVIGMITMSDLRFAEVISDGNAVSSDGQPSFVKTPVGRNNVVWQPSWEQNMTLGGGEGM
jgi:hypothetical protein